MNAHRLISVRSLFLSALTSVAVIAGTAPAQATKGTTPARTASTTKNQEKAKGKAAAPADPVDVNSANAAELMELPGVGEVTARKIIDGRPYKSVDDIAGAGVPAATLAKIKPLATARPLPSPVDVNIATADRIQTLPGVGPALAKAIIDGRPYAKFDDLTKVRGLGPAKLDELRGRVSFTKGTVETAKEKTKAVTEKAKAKVDAAKETVKTKADAAKAEMKTKADAAAEKVKSVAETTKEKAKSTADTAKAKVETAKEKAMEKVETAKAKIKQKAETAKAKIPAGQKININTASKEELDSLFGIGQARAQAIIDGRPYDKIEDIMKVKGIKEFEFGKIKDQIVVK